MFDIKDIFSGVSLLISIIALHLSAKNWKESNRPIVTATFDTNTGNVSTTIEIALFNTGNRPALDVVLYADKRDIEKILDKNAPQLYKDNIYKIFSGKNIIPIIHNNSNLKSAFGIASKEENNTFVWKSKIKFLIKYKDLNGKEYQTKQILQIKNYSGFSELIFQSN